MLTRVAFLVLVLAAPAGAEVASECDGLPAETAFSIERYYFSELGAPDDPLCTTILGSPICSLKGTFYVPKGAREAPAVVVNHGAANNDKKESNFCTVIEYFTKRGFVVFLPLRRGYLLKETPTDEDPNRFVVRFRNTGRYAEEVVDEAKGSGFPPEAEPYADRCKLHTEEPDYDCLTSALTHAETEEVGEAIRWLKRQKVGSSDTPLVDPGKVALVGHSGGAQVSIHAGADLTGRAQPQVAIAVSTAEKSWKGNKDVRADLNESVKNARVPLALMQPSNAKSLGSTEMFGQTAARNRKRYLAEIFPPVHVPPGEDVGDVAHKDFFEEPKHVNRWGAVALFFMAIYGVE